MEAPPELAKINTEFVTSKDAYKKMATISKQLIKHGHELSHDELALGDSLFNFSASVSNEEFSSLIMKYGELFRTLSVLHSQVYAKMEEDFAQVLAEILEDCKQAHDAKVKHERSRQEYDNAKTKAAKLSVSDAAKVKKLDTELSAFKEAMDDAYGDLSDELEYQIRKRDVVCREAFRSLIYSNLCFVETGSMLMKKLEPHLAKPKVKPVVVRKPKRIKQLANVGSVQLSPTVNPATRVFGVPLKELFERQSGSTPNSPGDNLQIPKAVDAMIEFLEQNSLKLEGCFRIPGSSPEINRLRELFDFGEIPEFKCQFERDVHVVTGLFKLFIRNLPEPLLTFEAYQPLLKVAECESREPAVIVPLIQAQLDNIPDQNKALLKRVIRMLYHISLHEDRNKMNASSIGIVFGLNMMRPFIDNPMELVKNSGLINKVCTLIVENYRGIFRVSDEEHKRDLSYFEELTSGLRPWEQNEQGFVSGTSPPISISSSQKQNAAGSITDGTPKEDFSSPLHAGESPSKGPIVPPLDVVNHTADENSFDDSDFMFGALSPMPKRGASVAFDVQAISQTVSAMLHNPPTSESEQPFKPRRPLPKLPVGYHPKPASPPKEPTILDQVPVSSNVSLTPDVAPPEQQPEQQQKKDEEEQTPPPAEPQPAEPQPEQQQPDQGPSLPDSDAQDIPPPSVIPLQDVDATGANLEQTNDNGPNVEPAL